MKFEFRIAQQDFELIEANIPYIKEHFPTFEIISEHVMVDDGLTEYTGGASFWDWRDVIFEMDSLNNFWYLAKMVQMLRLNQPMI